MVVERLNRALLAWFRWHQILFISGLGVMMVVDFFYLDGWWTFWPMIVWSMVFGVHFMIFRAQAVDDEWARERLIFEVYRPWDTGHIEEIRNSPFGKSIYRTELGRIDSDGKPLKPPPAAAAPVQSDRWDSGHPPHYADEAEPAAAPVRSDRGDSGSKD